MSMDSIDLSGTPQVKTRAEGGVEGGEELERRKEESIVGFLHDNVLRFIMRSNGEEVREQRGGASQ